MSPVSIRHAIAAGLALAASVAWAQSVDTDTMLPLHQRPTLFGGPNSPEQQLRDRGLGLDLSWTQFGQAMTSPSSGDNGMQWGGKLNAKFNLDFAKMGLWDGFSASALYEYKTGNSVNGFNGVLLPINTQMYEPADETQALSLTFTQRFSKDLSFSVGKFNMVDAASATPIVGGGGINTFWNLNFAAPPSGMVPPYITGFSGTLRTEPVNYTLMVYDPKDSQNGSGLSGWGQDGINLRLSLQFPIKPGGLTGYQTLVGVFSTRDQIDLADLPQLILPVPPGQNTKVNIKDNSWYLGWNFQQYLSQNPNNPAEGWGLFGQAFIADGNPNQYRWFVNFGVAGNSPIAGRGQDRFGVGVFNTSFSNDLTDSLKTLTGATISDERGIEMFYNAAVTPWFRLALNLQYIRPGVRDYGNALFAGLSAQIKF
jgi:porin